MGRPQNQIQATDPELKGFCENLRMVRQEAGNPTFRAMAASANCSPSRLSEAVAGRTLPTWEITRAYLNACHVSPEELQSWHETWSALRDAQAGKAQVVKAAGERPPTRYQTPAPVDAETTQSFGESLRHLVTEANRSQQWVAKKAGYSQSALSMAFSGRRMPTWTMVESVLGALKEGSRRKQDEPDMAYWQQRWMRLAERQAAIAEVELRLQTGEEQRGPTIYALIDRVLTSTYATRNLMIMVLASAVSVALVASTIGLIASQRGTSGSVATGMMSTMGALLALGASRLKRMRNERE